MPADDANADSADYYYNQDTLDFSVVLHRSDGSHAATVDSIGILRQVPPGFPTVYGTEPIIRLVRYVVPASLNNQSAYLAVCPTARGNRSHGFMRYDHRQVRFEARLQDTAIALLQDYYLGLLKPSLRLREMIEAGELGSLTVSPNPSNGAVSISGLFRAGDVVVVANSRGQEVFVHSYGPSEETVRTLECRLRTAGVYFVMQVRNSSVISNRRVIVE
jgi:hypothetical protein